MSGGVGEVVKAALHYHQRHPELDLRQDNFQYSMNQCLRAMARKMGCGDVGEDFEPLTLGYLDDLCFMREAEIRAILEAEDAKRKTGGVTEEMLSRFAVQMQEDAPPE